MQALARDAGKASSSCHLLQLDLVEQRSAMDSRLAEQRKSLDEAAARLGGVSERVEAHVVRSNEARESLYAEVASLRQATSAQLGAHATAMEQAKQKLLLLAQAVETQHSASKAQQGRVDALASAGEALSHHISPDLPTSPHISPARRRGIEPAAQRQGRGGGEAPRPGGGGVSRRQRLLLDHCLRAVRGCEML